MGNNQGQLKDVDITLIDNFKNHPFHVNNDDSLQELAKSIKDNGLLNPLVVRPKENGRYELISGHRRKLAMDLLGFKKVNALVKELSDEKAIIEMVDSNMYRDKVLPSEKAFAYKMKSDAMKHQGKKLKTLDNECPKSTTEEIGNKYGDSSSTVKNYIRLTYLIPELLQLVDDTVLKDKRTALTMGIKPAVELSYLTKEEQKLVYTEVTYDDLTPSHSQAKQIRELSKEKKLNLDVIESILSQQKGNQKDQISFNKDRIEKALPSELLKRDKRYIEQYIIKAIENYRSKELERGDAYDLM